VGRVLANENDVVNVLKKGNMMRLNVIDMAKMSYYEQLKVSFCCCDCYHSIIFILTDDKEHKRCGGSSRCWSDVYYVCSGRSCSSGNSSLLLVFGCCDFYHSVIFILIDRQDRHFRHASRMTGKIYMPMRTTIRETCQGSSDNVLVDVGEFEKAVDGALRVAR
jgi:hypothetical protein